MRLMDPEIGQFTSMDPLWTLDLQPYAYCGGKPTRCNDPLGLEGPGTVDSAKAVGKLAYDQVKGGLEGKASAPCSRSRACMTRSATTSRATTGITAA